MKKPNTMQAAVEAAEKMHAAAIAAQAEADAAVATAEDAYTADASDAAWQVVAAARARPDRVALDVKAAAGKLAHARAMLADEERLARCGELRELVESLDRRELLAALRTIQLEQLEMLDRQKAEREAIERKIAAKIDGFNARRARAVTLGEEFDEVIAVAEVPRNLPHAFRVVLEAETGRTDRSAGEVLHRVAEILETPLSVNAAFPEREQIDAMLEGDHGDRARALDREQRERARVHAPPREKAEERGALGFFGDLAERAFS